MTVATARHARRTFVPSVVQTSALDCGPAALKAVLGGFGLDLDYGRLREACQTDIDGTSIDVIEAFTLQLGFVAAQYIVPLDHLLLDETEALPCIAVTSLPSGLTHFVVLWRTHGGLVQVMDPGVGRSWRTRRGLLRDVFVHRFAVAPPTARDWLTSEGFIAPLWRRMSELGWPDDAIEGAIARAEAGEGWRPLAALDAAIRFAARLIDVRVIQAGTAAVQLATRLAADAARGSKEEALAAIPESYWSVIAESGGNVTLVGAVILHVAGPMDELQELALPNDDIDAVDEVSASEEDPGRSLGAELMEDTVPSPARRLLSAMLAESRTALPLVALALPLAGASVAIEALLLGGLASGARTDGAAIGLVLAFLASSIWLNLSTASLLLRLGRWLDIHLRIRLQTKLPLLGNYYFHSRLPSDLAHRAHELRALRNLPHIGANAMRVLAELLLTTIGIAWLFPAGALPVTLATLTLIGLPLAMMPLMGEQALRLQAHDGALVKFYLDSLLGLTPIQAHCAARPIRAEHEAMLTHWAAANRESFWTHLGGSCVGMIAGTSFALWIIGSVIDKGGDGATLVVVYWSLKLPVLAQALVGAVRQVPAMHHRINRLYEVLDASEEAQGRPSTAAPTRDTSPTGVHVSIRGVGVVAAGQRILSDIDVDLGPGEHVAIVGPSGSGKSSLVGLLLGWHRPSAGMITIDGEHLEGDVLQRLRGAIAWVDPGLQIWNRSLRGNLRYGNEGVDDEALAQALAQADLEDVVRHLPQGAETCLGEGGGLVSGGEGQRVRFGRALLRPAVRLVILDEPFRGLASDRRRELLAAARARWHDRTLVYVSHDIDTALGFPRVLVVEGGRIVEDGPPDALLRGPNSRLAALKEAHEAAQREVWGDPVWRRWRMERGELRANDGEKP